jgi:hypothetical protein
VTDSCEAIYEPSPNLTGGNSGIYRRSVSLEVGRRFRGAYCVPQSSLHTRRSENLKFHRAHFVYIEVHVLQNAIEWKRNFTYEWNCHLSVGVLIV